MLALKYLLMCGGLGMILTAVSILGWESYRELRCRKALASPRGALSTAAQCRWSTSLALGLLAWGPILLAVSIIVVPDTIARIR